MECVNLFLISLKQFNNVINALDDVHLLQFIYRLDDQRLVAVLLWPTNFFARSFLKLAFSCEKTSSIGLYSGLYGTL